jgi:hypothetical protein
MIYLKCIIKYALKCTILYVIINTLEDYYFNNSSNNLEEKLINIFNGMGINSTKVIIKINKNPNLFINDTRPIVAEYANSIYIKNITEELDNTNIITNVKENLRISSLEKIVKKQSDDIEFLKMINILSSTPGEASHRHLNIEILIGIKNNDYKFISNVIRSDFGSIKKIYKYYKYSTYAYSSPLIFAVNLGNLQMIKLLTKDYDGINGGINTKRILNNPMDNINTLPLSDRETMKQFDLTLISGKLGYINILTFLIENGANINRSQKYYKVSNTEIGIEIKKLLQEAGASSVDLV